MTPEAKVPQNIQDTIQSLMLTALINEVMKQPEVQLMIQETARKFVPVMLKAMAQMNEGAGK